MLVRLSGWNRLCFGFGVDFDLTGTQRGHRDGILELELFWERTVAGNVGMMRDGLGHETRRIMSQSRIDNIWEELHQP